ncbi:MAG: hypothetical protein WCC18_20105 [Candidatus Acidiferrales bacterium]
MDVISIHKPEPPVGIELHEFLNVFRVNPAMIAPGLPGVAAVVAKLLLLDPHNRFRKKVNATHMIPVRMADHNVRDLFRLHSGKFHRFVGTNVFGCGEFLRESIAVVAAVEENVAASAADQPNDHGQVHFLVRSAHHKVRGVILSRSIANRLNGIFRRGRRRKSRAGRNNKNDGE